jgi:hypothetical protein
MPPPGGIAGMGVSFFGFSATIASVVIKRPAIDAPSCSAIRHFGRAISKSPILQISPRVFAAPQQFSATKVW